MSSIKIEIDESDAKAILKALEPAALIRAIAAGMGRGARRVWEGLPKYPPAPATSSYRRTGELGRRLYVAEPVVSGSSVSVELGDNRPNAGYVIGPSSGSPHQAFMHVGRWWQLDVEMQANVSKVEDAVQDEINKLMGR